MPTKELYHKNKEYYDNYRNDNKEYYKSYHKGYDPEKRRRTHKKSEWKCSYKVKGNLDEIYDIWINATNCGYCNVKLTDDKKLKSTTRCLDHNHTTGYMREICCHACNTKIAKVDKRFVNLMKFI
tara:strand:- start:309 stop:683 length:375 start_codon:yes stop_codon:yes gene_type:complete